MGYFVTVTFDLNYAAASPNGRNVYKKITDELDELDISKWVTGKKRITQQLPSNTYVAEFDDEFDHQTEVVEFVKEKLKDIFIRYSVSGRYFISCGRNWAWKGGSF